MQPQDRVTQEEVDKELEILENRRENGKEKNTKLYNLKKANLHTMKKLVREGDKTWIRLQEIKQQ